MKRHLLAISLMCSTLAHAEIAPILTESCNLFPQAAKRAQCLRAAEQTGSSQQRGSIPNTPTHIESTKSASLAPRRSAARNVGGATCYTGPRGGTYTITASGRKNYNGC